MNENELKNLLREGDLAASIPAGGEALVEKVEGKLVRRRRRRVVMRTGAVAVLMMLGGSALLLWPDRAEKPVAVVPVAPVTKPTTQEVVLQSSVEALQQLQAQVKAQEERIAALKQAEAGWEMRRKLERKLAERGAVPPEVAAGELAAKTVVELGDVIRTNKTRREEARETYAGVIQDFPQTVAAQTARERLNELGGM